MGSDCISSWSLLIFLLSRDKAQILIEYYKGFRQFHNHIRSFSVCLRLLFFLFVFFVCLFFCFWGDGVFLLLLLFFCFFCFFFVAVVCVCLFVLCVCFLLSVTKLVLIVLDHG